MFNGRLKITICGAKELQLTNCMVRLKDALTLGGSSGAKDKPKDVSTLDPYVAIDVDQVSIERTSTKGETLCVYRGKSRLMILRNVAHQINS